MHPILALPSQRLLRWQPKGSQGPEGAECFACAVAETCSKPEQISPDSSKRCLIKNASLKLQKFASRNRSLAVIRQFGYVPQQSNRLNGVSLSQKGKAALLVLRLSTD